MEWLVLILVYLYGVVGAAYDVLSVVTIISIVIFAVLNFIYLISRSDYPNQYEETYGWFMSFRNKVGILALVLSLAWVAMPTQKTILYMAAGFGSVKMVEEMSDNEVFKGATDRVVVTAGNTMDYFNTWLTTEMEKMKAEEGEEND